MASLSHGSWKMLAVTAVLFAVLTGCVSGQSQSGLSYDAIIGIVVAGIVVLLFIIGLLVALLMCRIQKQTKLHRTRSEEIAADINALQESGQGLPVEIPIQALARVPPPQYTSSEDLSRPVNERSRQTPMVPKRAGISYLPPPLYSAPSVDPGVYHLDSSLEAPPQYSSRQNLARSSQHAMSNSAAGRELSVDSFREFPSMSDILLTSSRSDLPTVGLPSTRQSSGAFNIGADGGGGSSEVQRRASLGGGMERGVCAEELVASNLMRQQQRHRVMSESLTDVHHGAEAVHIPDGGLQKKVRAAAARRQQQASTRESGESRGHGIAPKRTSRSTAPSRSSPSLSSGGTSSPNFLGCADITGVSVNSGSSGRYGEVSGAVNANVAVHEYGTSEVRQHVYAKNYKRRSTDQPHEEHTAAPSSNECRHSDRHNKRLRAKEISNSLMNLAPLPEETTTSVCIAEVNSAEC